MEGLSQSLMQINRFFVYSESSSVFFFFSIVSIKHPVFLNADITDMQCSCRADITVTSKVGIQKNKSSCGVPEGLVGEKEWELEEDRKMER